MRHCGRCGAKTDEWGLHTTAERDHYREALEQIAGHFLPGDERRIYGGPMATLDLIRDEARAALATAAPFDPAYNATVAPSAPKGPRQ